jgi:hypothetical protein
MSRYPAAAASGQTEEETGTQNMVPVPILFGTQIAI